MNNINLVELLATDNFAVYNKKVAKKLGIENAILLGTLCSLQRSFRSKEFYRSEDELEEDTLLSVYSIRKCKKQLEKAGILVIEKKGLPAKHYFKINERELLLLITSSSEIEVTSTCENLTSSGNEMITTSTCENNTTIYNKYNNKYNNKQYNNIYNLAEEEQDNIAYKEICDYLNEKVGSNYKYTSNKTRNLIKARFNEGFTLEHFKIVIDKKVIEWKNSEMEKYLRPETLFGTKFESYLNQNVKVTTKNIAPAFNFEKFK